MTCATFLAHVSFGNADGTCGNVSAASRGAAAGRTPGLGGGILSIIQTGQILVSFCLFGKKLGNGAACEKQAEAVTFLKKVTKKLLDFGLVRDGGMTGRTQDGLFLLEIKLFAGKQITGIGITGILIPSCAKARQ